VAFADAARGYAVGERGVILRTDDGGKTWKGLETEAKTNLYSVAVATRDEALAVGEQGRVLQTKDGGETWDAVATLTSASLFGASYRGGSAAWVAGRGGTILKRTDALATVKIPKPRIPPALRGGPPRLKPQDNEEALAPILEDDIPRATPPKAKAPSKP
jgi:photosystem II stability/assembly factor-like uncharacterized protein